MEMPRILDFGLRILDFGKGPHQQSKFRKSKIQNPTLSPFAFDFDIGCTRRDNRPRAERGT